MMSEQQPQRKKRHIMTQADYIERATAVINEKIKQKQLLRESDKTFGKEVERRARAKQYTDNGNKIFLNPQDIQDSLANGFTDVFYTTLGGELRPMTEEDLRAIDRNIRLLRDQYNKGITAKQVLDLSLKKDKDRCNQQIHLCVPLSLRGNVVRFLVNASGDNGVQHHYLHVQFENMASATLSTDFNQKAVNKVSNGKLRFECDCPHHQFTFRYLATIAGWNYGREEHGFPKIKNPTLSGVGCKHVLRVMQYIRSPMFQNYFYRTIEKERKKALGSTTHKTSIKRLENKVEQLVNKGLKDLQHDDSHAIKQMRRLSDKMSRQQQRQAQKEIEQKIKKVAKEQGDAVAKKIEHEFDQEVRANQANTLKGMGLSKRQIDNFLKYGTFTAPKKGKKS